MSWFRHVEFYRNHVAKKKCIHHTDDSSLPPLLLSSVFTLSDIRHGSSIVCSVVVSIFIERFDRH